MINFLNEYKPYDELEKKDIELFFQFYDKFGKEMYHRTCLPFHITNIVWVVNPSRTKVLMGYHNIYKAFTWFGGHADGNLDLLNVAKKEMVEETGIDKFKVLNGGNPIDFCVLNVNNHVKKGEVVSDHLHFSPTYVFEVSEDEEFRIAKDENSAIKWLTKEEIISDLTEEKIQPIYLRIMKKIEEKNI